MLARRIWANPHRLVLNYCKSCLRFTWALPLYRLQMTGFFLASFWHCFALQNNTFNTGSGWMWMGWDLCHDGYICVQDRLLGQRTDLSFIMAYRIIYIPSHTWASYSGHVVWIFIGNGNCKPHALWHASFGCIPVPSLTQTITCFPGMQPSIKYWWSLCKVE